jgi:hypothetical protein
MVPIHARRDRARSVTSMLRLNTPETLPSKSRAQIHALCFAANQPLAIGDVAHEEARTSPAGGDDLHVMPDVLRRIEHGQLDALLLLNRFDDLRPLVRVFCFTAGINAAA